MPVALAPFKLTSGVDEDALVMASDEFEAGFAQLQDGSARFMSLMDTDAEPVVYEALKTYE